MTKYAIAQKQANANRVYIMGASSGAMVTQAMLAIYPDVFKGGAEFAGVPAGCWAVGNTTDGQWSSSCADGQVLHTPQEWGDIARAMYPGYTGFRPRIQLWHGSADTIINYANYTEAVDQWTNVLGLPATPTTTGTLSIGGHNYNRRQWKDSCGIVVLDAFDRAQWTARPGREHERPVLPPVLQSRPGDVHGDRSAGRGLRCDGHRRRGWHHRRRRTRRRGRHHRRRRNRRTRRARAAPPERPAPRGSAGRGGTTGSAGTTGTAGTTGPAAARRPERPEPAARLAPPEPAETSSGRAGTTGTSGEAGTTGTGNTGGDNSTGTAGTSGTGNTGGTGPPMAPEAPARWPTGRARQTCSRWRESP